jgi:glycine C-acetyltransferase
MVFVCIVENVLRINNDVESMEKNLQRATKLATETVVEFYYYRRCFWMRGQQGKLKEVVAMKQKLQVCL